MSKKKRTTEQIERDTIRTHNLRVKGHSYRDIAKIISNENDYNVSHQVLFECHNNYFNKIKESFKDQHLKELQVQIDQKDKIINECWIAWEKSKGQQERRELKTGEGSYVKTVHEESYGDTAYLQMIEKAMDAKAKLMGLYIQKENEQKGGGNTYIQHNNTTYIDIKSIQFLPSPNNTDLPTSEDDINIKVD